MRQTCDARTLLLQQALMLLSWGLALLGGLGALGLTAAMLRMKPMPPGLRRLPLLYPLLTLLGLSTALGLLRYGVLTTPPETDFLNLLQFGRAGWAALCLITIAWLCVYLLSQGLLQGFRVLNIPQNQRILIFVASAVLAWAPGLAETLQVKSIMLALLFFAYLLLFDLYLDYRSSSLTWMLIWALFLAGLGTVFINIYRTEKALYMLEAEAQRILREGLSEQPISPNRVYAQALARSAPPAFSGLVADKDAQVLQSWGKDGLSLMLQKINQQRAAASPRIARQENWLQSGQLHYLQTASSGTVIGLVWPLPGLRQLMPLFSLLFLALVLLSALLAFINRLAPFLPSSATLPFSWAPTFRSRIQRITLGITGLSFALIFVFAFPYLEKTFVQRQENQLLAKAAVLEEEIQAAALATGSNTDGALFPQLLPELARRYDSDLDLYDARGRLVASSMMEIYQQGWKAAAIPEAVQEQGRTEPLRTVLHQDTLRGKPLFTLYVPVNLYEAQYLAIPFRRARTAASEELGGFMGAMITISVFLLLIAGAMAMLIANRFSAPLIEVSERLRKMEIGGNQRLEWPNADDEVGAIISAYNDAIEQVERSAEQLKQTEREAAWKEMAKQVAHEIKNPLTPMKLHIQYLLHAFRQDPERAATLLPEAAKTLTEQIDGLARIATEFSNFAQMPQADNAVFPLEEALHASVALFREQIGQHGELHVDPLDSSIRVFADKQQLIRVFNNLLQNAFQAIPADRPPRIRIECKKQDGDVAISIRDNGMGIPPEIREKVFSPNFTTKSSGMGLGLAMCKNIVQQAQGQIFFETAEGTGTTFFVVLPQQG